VFGLCWFVQPRSCFDRSEYWKLRQTAHTYAKQGYVGHAFVKGKSVSDLSIGTSFLTSLSLQRMCPFEFQTRFCKTNISSLSKEKKIRSCDSVRLFGIVTFTNCWIANYQDKEANLVEIAAKVTEIPADLILMAPPDDQSKLMADILASLGSFVLGKKEDADSTNPRRSHH
jgi:hypothetical protein